MSAQSNTATRPTALSAVALVGLVGFVGLVRDQETPQSAPVVGAGYTASIDELARLASTRPERSPAIEIVRVASVDPASHLADLQAAFVARDGARVEASIRAWLATHGVEGLLESLADAAPNSEVRDALAMILRTAVIRAAEGDPALAPWTAADLVAQAVTAIGADLTNPTILLGALHDRGADADPELLAQLLEHQDGASGPVADFAHQIDTIRLMEAWISDLPAEVVPRLDATLVDPEQSASARARAASLLLQRDWRTHGQQLVGSIEQLTVGPLGELDLVQQDVRLHLGQHVERLAAHERGEFLQLVSEDLPAFRVAADALDPADAAEWAARLDPESVGPVAHAALRFRAGGDDAIDAGLELLPTLRTASDFSAHACVHRLLTLDGAGDPRVHQALSELFEQRASRRDFFWRGIGWQPDALSDRQLEEGVLPWLLLSIGEQHPTRARLVAHVQQRFPGRYASL